MDIKSMLTRELNLPKNHHFFLFGARQTGKTTLVQEQFSKVQLKSYNLLRSEEYTKFVSSPSVLREEILGLSQHITHVFLDEVQRVPELLNEVQYLIDQKVRPKFILTGSSARKLKRGMANLLGGRAWTFNLYPMTQKEVGERMTLNEILAFGSLPPNVTDVDLFARNENLRSYVDNYLREEIEAEALSRNIGGFIRFLSVAAQTNGELLNYSNIARDVNLSPVTVKEYFKILEDTLIGTFLMPFSFSERKKHKQSPKFYFFDTGVLRAIQKRLGINVEPKTYEYGNYFETFIINEVIKISSYHRKDLSLSFLRTVNDVEVDLVIDMPGVKRVGVEIKSKETPIALDFEAGFKALKKLDPKAKCMCVCTGNSRRMVDGYEVLPWGEFLEFVRGL